MNDDGVIVGLLFAVFVFSCVSFLVGTRSGYDDGLVDGKNQGIMYCMEQPKECKIQYDYLKLQENSK